MLRAVLVAAFFAACVYAWGDTLDENRCASYPPRGTTESSLPNKIKLPENYLVEFILTNWVDNSTMHVKEIADGSKTFGQATKRTGTTVLSSVNGLPVQILPNGTCSVHSGEPLFTIPKSIEDWLKGSSKNASDLVKRIADFSNDNNGYLYNTSIEAGVRGAEWMFCTNSTNLPGFQLLVTFAGQNSISPASSSFNNPLVLSLVIREYKNLSDINSPVVNDVSFVFTRFDSPKSDPAYKLPMGTYCSGLPTVPLPANLSSEFSSTVHHGGLPKEVNSQLFYSSTQSLISVSSSLVDGVFPILNEKKLPESTATVVHDFGNGLEFVLSSGGRCLNVASLPNDTSDVTVESGVLSLKDNLDLFLPVSTPNWTKFDDELSQDGNFAIYRSLDGNTTVEVKLLDSKVAEIAQYRMEQNGYVVMSSIRFLSTPYPTVSLESAISNCYPPQPNNTIVFEVKDHSLSNVFSSGVSTVCKAIAAQIGTVAPISSPRVHCNFVPSGEKDLSVIVSIADVPAVQAAAVKTRKTETPAYEVVDKLNATVFSEDWKITVPVAGKTEDWIVPAKSLSLYPRPLPPTPEPTFQGYTGGAMFVLAIFMLILGAGIGVGALFFITKRQRISTLAYQVFE